MAFVRNCEFDNVGVFTYSDEEGTAAYLLPDKVDAKTAKQRRARLKADATAAQNLYVKLLDVIGNQNGN